MPKPAVNKEELQRLSDEVAQSLASNCTPGTPGGLNGMEWWIWLKMSKQKKVSEMKSGFTISIWIYGVFLSVIFAPYEEVLDVVSFPESCWDYVGAIRSQRLSRFSRIHSTLLRLVKQNKQLRSQITSTKDRKFGFGTEIPNAPCKENLYEIRGYPFSSIIGVKNGCISNSRFLSFGVIFHFHDGRKGNFSCGVSVFLIFHANDWESKLLPKTW